VRAFEGELKSPEYVDDPKGLWFWRGPQGVIIVHRDAQALAIGKVWHQQIGIVERLRRRWRRWFP
jgi:hypothetical protein